jgi:hypothetical protein
VHFLIVLAYTGAGLQDTLVQVRFQVSVAQGKRNILQHFTDGVVQSAVGQAYYTVFLFNTEAHRVGAFERLAKKYVPGTNP